MTTDLFFGKDKRSIMHDRAVRANNMPLGRSKELTGETIPQWAGPTVTPPGLIESTNEQITAKFDLVYTHPVLLSMRLHIF